MRLIKICITLLFTVLLGSGVGFASEEAAHNNEEKEFNVRELALHHIQDAHEWHILDYTDKNNNHHDFSIPLPVILIADGHLDIFMSGKFGHGKEIVHKGDRHYRLHHGDIYLTDADGRLHYEESELGEQVVSNDKPLDFSITKTVAGMFVSVILILVIFLSVARSYRKRPGRPAGLQAFMEPVILFVRDDMAKPNIGEEKYERFLPYILTVFFFVLVNNLMGLVPIVPGGANVTGNIAVTFTLAAFTMLITNISGSRQYWRHVFATPGVPWWLYPIMIPVELIGIISKPFALMVRLFANIAAGHIVVLSLVALIFIFESLWLSPISAAFVVFMDVLEILVAFIQAYIFALLSALFIGLAVQSEH